MARARTELIHCDNCGEDYAATYRRCPFCDAKPGQRFSDRADDYEEPLDDDEYADAASRRGGKRLSGGQPRRNSGRGAGFWVRVGLYVISAAVIIAALWVVCAYLFPRLFSQSAPESQAPSAVPSSAVSADPAPSALPSAGASPALGELPAVDDDPLSLDSPDLPPVESDPAATQAPVATQAPISTQTPAAPQAAALKLSSTDFTLSPRYPDYQMEIEGVGRGLATYSIANEAVATVSSTGLVTAVGNGSTTLTVTGKEGGTATAIVRVSGMGAAQPPSSEAPASEAPASENPAASPSPAGGASLNYTDFSISAAYPDPVRLRVSNGQAAGWASSDGGVASVSENGTVTAVGNGRATITCTLTDGATLSCVVYVSGK